MPVRLLRPIAARVGAILGARHSTVGRTHRPLVAAALAMSVLAACGGGGDGPTDASAVARLDASTSSLSLTGFGAAAQVTVTGRTAGGSEVSSFDVTWSTSNATIADVSGSGRSVSIVARSPGTAIIRATSGSASVSIAVTVLGVRAVQLTPASATIRAGDTRAFSAVVEADPGVSRTVTWTTGDATIATVDQEGIVTGVGAGTTTVRASATADTRVSAVAAVSVTGVGSLSVLPRALRIGTQEQRTLVATVNGTPSTDLLWRTDNPAVATVSPLGVVTGIQIGTTNIVAILPNDTLVRQVIPVSVEPVIRDITLVPTAATMLAGTTRQFIADVTADGGVSQAITWQSSNTAVAIVSGTGLVTAIGNGQATISAVSVVDTLRRGNAVVTVAVGPDVLEITQRDVAINVGEQQTLTVTITGPAGVIRDVEWSSSVPTVAGIASDGRVTGLALGTTLITAVSTIDPTKRDTMTLSVVPRVATTWTAGRINGALADRVGALYAVNATTAYAVDQLGDIYRYDGVTWTRVLAGNTLATQFTAIHGSSASNIIAVGTGGVIARFNGTTWSAMPSGTTRTLHAVFVDGATTATAVGDNGTALRLSGASWSAGATGVTAPLYGVFTAGGTTFAVGGDGVVVRSSGGAWTRLFPPTTQALRGVFAFGPTAVTIVGDFGTVLTYDGNTFDDLSSGSLTDDLRAVWGTTVGGTRVFVGGQGVLRELVGTNLSDLAPPYLPDAFVVQVDADGNLWVAGERGLVLRRIGATWATLNLVPDLLDVWATSDNNAWTVGEFGFVYRWNGSTWDRQPTPTTTRLNTVWAASPSVAFVGGDFGTLLRWNGSVWSPMDSPTSSDILAMWGWDPSHVFATTLDGEVLRFNGTSWIVVAQQAEPLYGIFGTGPDEVFAVGGGGTVLRFNGVNWTADIVPGMPLLIGVWANASPSTVLAVGESSDNPDDGIALRLTSEWTETPIPTSQVLTSVWGLSRFELFATGVEGGIIRWNGSAWTPMSSNTQQFLWSVSGSPSGNGGAFAVGWNGTVVRGTSVGAARAAATARATRPSLEPSAAARRSVTPSRAVPVGEARRSVRQMHQLAPARTARRMTR